VIQKNITWETAKLHWDSFILGANGLLKIGRIIMEDITKSIVEKISSYNIFNNFFPGVIFCYIVEKTTRFSIAGEEIWEMLFIYYFIGMIISRISSIFIEKILKSIKIKNRKLNSKEPFLKFAPYEQYIDASEKQPFIKTLNETNNAYRTIITVFVIAIAVKIYDWLLCDLVERCGQIGNNLVFIGMSILIIALFVGSYKKQTDYIRSRVEKYSSKKNN